MTRIRLIPLVALATAALFILKTTALIGQGGYVLTGTGVATAQQSVEETPADTPPSETPAEGAEASPDDGMSPSGMSADAMTAERMEGSEDTAAEADAPRSPLFGKKVDLAGKSDTEKALLNRLGNRRKLLDKREEELKLRESLLAAAEKRLEEKVAELKTLEQNLDTAVTKKQEEKSAEIGRLITMYENMKPNAAAAIFDRLAMDVLVEVARKMKPRKMAPILGKMSPEAAERLTVELAGRARSQPPVGARELPKIQGQPIPPQQ